MAKLSHNDSRRMYSWWWDSHISPKNSKWLQENLTDMDAKVKSMIKLIEEDADSFARRAEMYYKKRPELMKMVEEFYRAYRALAERYDHATGVIRQAHRTMSEACPAMMFGDDSPATTISGTDIKTPELSLLNGDFTDESESVTTRMALNLVERVRRGLNFDETEENESCTNAQVGAQQLSELDLGSESSEAEIVKLKEAIAKLEAEKEAGLVLYRENLNKLSQLEAEISKACEDKKALNDRVREAEDGVVVLRESLSRAEAEKEYNLHEYQKCLVMISKCNDRADSAESEVKCLKEQLENLGLEKESALNQYMQSLETISNLESKLRMSEEDLKCLKERVAKFASDFRTRGHAIPKLVEEKEDSYYMYCQCMEKISGLELKLVGAEEEAKRLNIEIETVTSKLRGAEKQCVMLELSNQSLQTEMESLMLKMGTQNEELTEKQKELGRLWACVQEERLRFVEAETAFQTLQRLHAQTQEELRAMACELQNRVETLKAVETHKQTLLDEVSKVKEENKNLDEINTTSALSMKDMREEISSLIESKGKLENEVELRVDQRNALQQEIYCLREEFKVLNEKHISFLDQVHDLGLIPENLGSHVKDLRGENMNLKETCQREGNEKADLLQKLVIMDQLLEKNSLLETSLSDVNTELEGVKGKLDVLEQSCETLLKEKSTLLDEKASLITQLDETKKNLEKLSETNAVALKSLSDAERQLEALKAKSKISEDSCQLLVNEKADLVSKHSGLTNDLNMAQTSLEELKKQCSELQGRCLALEIEKASTLVKVEELQINLDIERRKHASYVETSETRLNGVEAEMCLLRDECSCKSKELDRMLCNVVGNEIELLVLHLTSQEMTDNNCFLLKENQRLLEEKAMSKSKISLLEKDNLVQKAEIESVSGQVYKLRAGNSKLLEVLDIVEDHICKDRTEQDKVCGNLLSSKVEEMKEALVKAEEINFTHTVDFVVLVILIEQLKLDFQNIEMEKNKFECDVKAKTDQVSELREEAYVLYAMNEELKSKLKEGDCQKNELTNHIEALNMKLLAMHETCRLLQEENLETSREKRSFEEKNSVLSHENTWLCGEVLDLENFSFIFRSCADEKFTLLKKLENDVRKLGDTNAGLLGKLTFTEVRLQESKIENLHLREILQKSENDLNVTSTAKDQVDIELKEAEKKLNNTENEKLHLMKNMEDLTMELSESKTLRDQQEHHIQKLSADNELINSKLESKINEIDELETEVDSIFGQLQYFLFSHLMYEQKFHELRDHSLYYMVQNEALKTQLAAYGPEIASLRECLMLLDNHMDTHIKFQDPQNEREQGSEAITDQHDSVPDEDNIASISSSFTDLHDLRVRLEAIVKAAIEIKERMLQENLNLQSKLDTSTRQLELLQSAESVRNRMYHHPKPTSEITEESENTTKDIVLDQVSDNSSYGFSRRDHLDSNDQIVELWESQDLDGTLGLTIGKSKNIMSPRTNKTNEFRRVKSLKKPKYGYSNSVLVTEKDLGVDPLQETNKKRVLERLDSDGQKLENLQITVQDLKSILEVTEKGKRGKAVIECEAMKVQLEEADAAIMKLFEFNKRLTKNVEDDASLHDLRSSFDLERDGEDSNRRRRVLEQARKISEKIGRLQMEIQKLQFVLLKMDDENKGKSKLSEARRRVLLRDYLYGGERTVERRKKTTRFCACVQPSTAED